jgi:hypothetical protein
MVLVLGVWTYLNWRSCSGQPLALDSAGGTASSGSAYHAFGGTGGLASSLLFSPRPSLPGTAKASSSTGAGSPGAAQWAAPRSILSFAR